MKFLVLVLGLLLALPVYAGGNHSDGLKEKAKQHERHKREKYDKYRNKKHSISWL